MNVNKHSHPEKYEDFKVGDEVFCLAWIGKPFKVVKKDDATRQISIDGQGPCSLPDGALLDLPPAGHFMLTHNLWDQLWYWPDRQGETYKQVVDRFVENHREGEIVTGYAIPAFYAMPIPDLATTYRLSFGAFHASHSIHAMPVSAVAPDGKSIVREYDPTISDEKWLQSGPVQQLRIQMNGYRWALAYGHNVLNWQDFPERPAA